MDNMPSVGVVVAEPESNLLNRLVDLCGRVWHAGEVLPRKSNAELKNAAKWLDAEVVVARLSVLQVCPTFADCVYEMVARGTQFVCIQDTSVPFSPKGWMSLGDMHFVSDQNQCDVLLNLLINLRVRSISLGRLTHN